jgi:predicted PolB exonuclease-like 3'-5' exonuclease
MHPPSTIKNILFIDIETVSCASNHEALSENQQLLWNKKAAALGKIDPEEARELFFERAAIYAEFGKVIVIGLGCITFDGNGEPVLRIHTLSDHNEKVLLEKFKNIVEEKFQPENLKLCAHNGKEFDYPYLCRRMLVNGISLPKVLQLEGKKPWEVGHLDTMEMWRFGDRKSFTSLDLLANLFGISSSKSLMDGSQVNHFYYIENDLASIATYCAQDVIVTAQIYLKLNNWQTIKETNIIFA